MKQQRDIGLDIVNEGEYTKGGDWLSYVDYRFGGFSERPRKDGKPLILQGKDQPPANLLYESGAILILAINLAVDVLYAYVDPRIRLGGANE